MSNAPRDENRVPTIIGVSSVDLATPTKVAVNPTTGAVLVDGTSLYTTLDTRYLKLSGSLAEVSNHSHTVLTDIGTNTHAQIDTFIGTTVPTTYLPLAGGTMVGNLIFNDSISALFGTGSDLELFHNGTDSYIQNNTGGIVIENDASDGDITFKVNDGGVDKTVMTLDGATGNVGIGTTDPGTYKLNVAGNTYVNGNLKLYAASGPELNLKDVSSGFRLVPASGVNYLQSFTTETGGSAADLRFTDHSGYNTWMAITSTGKVGIGTATPGTAGLAIMNGNVGIGITAPLAKLHIDQSSTTAAKPVLIVDQADVSEEFIKFIGTSTTDASQSLIDAADMTTAGALVGWLKIYVQDDQATNPITDGAYYIPFYSAPSA